MKHFFSIIGGMGTIATESYVRLINHRVKIGNVTYSLPELADAFNLSVETVYSRWKRGKRGEELIKPVR